MIWDSSMHTQRATAQKTVLVYSRCDIIGDAVLKLPVIRALRTAFPDHHITWMAGEGSSVFASSLKPLVEDCLDEVVEHAGIGAQLTDLLSSRLSKIYFDTIIDTQQSVKTALILRRIAHRSFVSAAARGWLSNGPLAPRSRGPQAVQHRIRGLIQRAVGREVSLVHSLPIPARYHASASQLLPEGPLYVGLAPGAGARKKCWPLDRFIALAQAQMRLHRVPVFFIGPQELDWVGTLRAAVPSALFPELMPAAREHAGPLLAIALAARLHLAVSNDSGIGHLLAAGECRLIRLFGPTDSRKFTSPTRPCVILEARHYGGREMQCIPYEAVAEALERSI